MHRQIRILLWLCLFLGLAASCLPEPPVQGITGGLEIVVTVQKRTIDPQERWYVWVTLKDVHVPAAEQMPLKPCPFLIPPQSTFSIKIGGGKGALNVFIGVVSGDDLSLLAQGSQSMMVDLQPAQNSASVTIDQWEKKNEPWTYTCANGVIPDMASPPDLRSDLHDPPPDMTGVGYNQTTEDFCVRGFSPCRHRYSYSYLLLVPRLMPMVPLPLVIALHKDGSSAQELQREFRVEDAIPFRAIVLYLDAASLDGAGPQVHQFHHEDLRERGIEADNIKELIDTLVRRNLVDRSRVLLTGFGGGGAMASAVGCVLGKSVLKGAASMSGPLYTINDPQGIPSFATLRDGTQLRSCSGEPPFLLFWGQADQDKDTVYRPDGLGTLERHRTQQASCPANPNRNAAPPPCVDYAGCVPGLRWCSIPNLAHAIWPSAASATWQWFSAL